MPRPVASILVRPTLAAVAAACVATLVAGVAPVRAHEPAGAGPAAHAGHRPATPAAKARPVQTDWGIAADPKAAVRTVRLDMDDTMRFTPDRLTVRLGETVRLVVRNRGRVMHEIVLGTDAALARHARQMRSDPGMAHDAPSMAHVAPGATGELTWTFNRAGEFGFACLVPGHFEAGMAGRVVVAVAPN